MSTDEPADPLVRDTTKPSEPSAPPTPRPTRIPRSEAQREASRRNGARSRGPKTARGKRRSSQNAYKHGLLAMSLYNLESSDSDRWIFHRALENVHDYVKPCGAAEDDFAITLAWNFAQLFRSMRAVGDLSAKALITWYSRTRNPGGCEWVLSELQACRRQWEEEGRFSLSEGSALAVAKAIREAIIYEVRNDESQAEMDRLRTQLEESREDADEEEAEATAELDAEAGAGSEDGDDGAEEGVTEDEDGEGPAQPPPSIVFEERGESFEPITAARREAFHKRCMALEFSEVQAVAILTGQAPIPIDLKELMPALLDLTERRVASKWWPMHSFLLGDCTKPAHQALQGHGADLELLERYHTTRQNSFARAIKLFADFRSLGKEAGE